MNPLDLVTAYQQSAVVAAACGTSPRATRALLGSLVALGLAEHGPDGYALSADGAVLAGGHPESVARIVAKEWFFYQAWAGLPDSVRDGHARIPRWRDRLADDPARPLDFLRALDDLAARFGGELPALAGLDGPGRLLDVGGGAGTHAAALARAVPGLEATVLDLLPPARCQAIVATAAGLLAPGGTLLVYEWVLDETGDTPPAVALFDLMMLVENEGGAAWTAARLSAWLEAAGLAGIELRRGAGPIAVLRASAPSDAGGG